MFEKAVECLFGCTCRDTVCEKSVHKLWQHVRFLIFLLFDHALFYSLVIKLNSVKKVWSFIVFFFSNLESQDFLVHPYIVFRKRFGTIPSPIRVPGLHSPWKVLEFHFWLKSPWIFFNFKKCSGLENVFKCFLFKTEFKSKSREFKGDLHIVFCILCKN